MHGPGVEVMPREGNSAKHTSTYSCAVPLCSFIADFKCDKCMLWIFSKHGPEHEKHQQLIDEDVEVAFQAYVDANRPSESMARAKAAATSDTTATGTNAKHNGAINTRSKEGRLSELKRLHCSDREIQLCNDDLKALQTLAKEKRAAASGSSNKRVSCGEPTRAANAAAAIAPPQHTSTTITAVAAVVQDPFNLMIRSMSPEELHRRLALLFSDTLLANPTAVQPLEARNAGDDTSDVDSDSED
jgi:hypothetical protein